MSVYSRSSEIEIFCQDAFWREKKGCNENMLSMRRKRVAGEREDEVSAMKKKFIECLEECEKKGGVWREEGEARSFVSCPQSLLGAVVGESTKEKEVKERKRLDPNSFLIPSG